jgi:hypothetical protein
VYGVSFEDPRVRNVCEVEAIQIFPSVETKVIHQGGKTGIIVKPPVLEKIAFKPEGQIGAALLNASS